MSGENFDFRIQDISKTDNASKSPFQKYDPKILFSPLCMGKIKQTLKNIFNFFKETTFLQKNVWDVINI